MIRTIYSTRRMSNHRALPKDIAFTVQIALAGIILLALTAAPAIADSIDDSPAAIAKSSQSAETALNDFAKTWMAKIKSAEAHSRDNPTVRPGAASSVVSYRGFSDDYQLELRPTGHPGSPFIGILRYQEQLYTCRKAGGSDCSVASVVPVTEIFRYQGGRWIY